jgi:hypothetical protein
MAIVAQEGRGGKFREQALIHSGAFTHCSRENETPGRGTHPSTAGETPTATRGQCVDAPYTFAFLSYFSVVQVPVYLVKYKVALTGCVAANRLAPLIS